MDQFTHTTARMHYDLRLRLDPPVRKIHVSGSLVFHAPQEGAQQARFYLNRQLALRSVEGRRVLGYHYELHPSDPDATLFPHAGALDVHFDPPLPPNAATLVQFEYEGRLSGLADDSPNLLTAQWVELGSHLPWYPVQAGGSSAGLSFTLEVTCPPDYSVASYGKAERQGTTWLFNWLHPTNELPVFAGRSLRSTLFESESNRAHLHSVSLSDNTIHMLGDDLLWALERFSGWFGPVRPAEFSLIQSPRASGGSYARRGLVVLSDLTESDYLNQREAYLRYLAHEAAHAWWWGAPSASWEDWLNESFAEYSALIAIRERYGAPAFNRSLERKRELVGELLPRGAQPLWGFDRSDTATTHKQDQVEAQLYHKGPLLLHDLSERIGSRRFFDLCRGMLWSEARTTAHFLDLLEELEDPAARAWMEEKLKSL